MKAKKTRIDKCNCLMIKSIKEKRLVPPLFSRGPRNLYHFFPSKDTTRDKQAPSSTLLQLNATKSPPLTSKQVYYLSMHNLRQPNTIEDFIV